MAHVASSNHRHVPGGFDLERCGLAVVAYPNPIAGDSRSLVKRMLQKR